jgi:hypothetical protein
MRRFLLGLVVAGLAAGCGTSTSSDETDTASGEAAEETPPPAPMATLPAGTPVLVSLRDDLSTDTATDGMIFTAGLVEPIVIDGQTVIYSGTPVRGVVTNVHGEGDTEPVQMTLELQQVGPTAGEYADLEASPVVLKDSGSVEGDVEKVAAGAVAGGVIGAIVGGGKGAAIGAGVGAGAGTIVAIVTKDDEIHLAPGQKVQFTLARSAKIPLPVNS